MTAILNNKMYELAGRGRPRNKTVTLTSAHLLRRKGSIVYSYETNVNKQELSGELDCMWVVWEGKNSTFLQREYLDVTGKEVTQKSQIRWQGEKFKCGGISLRSGYFAMYLGLQVGLSLSERLSYLLLFGRGPK